MRVLALVILLVLLAAGVWYLGFGDSPTLAVTDTLYDTDADGHPDLVHRRIGARGTLWSWDRDGDDEPEVLAYDAAVDADGNLRPTGSVTAWDLGADGILEEGEVPGELQETLRSDTYRRALQEAGPGAVELVDADTRGFVREIRDRYDAWRLSGLQMPIVGAQLPDQDNLLPGARRAYRFGIHQGFDMYPGHIGVPTGYGAPVVAAKDGTVVRADVDYQELSPQEYDRIIEASREAGTTPPDELDALRGRQVWIDHGHGVVSRYAHLSGISEGITEGTEVDRGEIVGFVGNSGTSSGAASTQEGAHLHYELQIDGSYLGEGMTPDEIRRRTREIFDLQPAG